MIFSNLRYGDTLAAYPDGIRRALAWLQKTDVMALEAGRVEIEGASIYALVQDLTTHPMEGTHPEVHKKYIDLMYWPEAGERIGVAPYTGKEALYDEKPEKDVAHLESVEQENILTTAPGDFCVLFPWDAHRPGLDPAEGQASFRKIVMKVSMDLI